MPKQRERNAVQSIDDRIALDGYQRFAIRLAFDGTTYQGFQSQPYKNTIQDQLEHRLRGLLRRNVKVIAWGRTDSGVHACGALVTVDLSNDEVAKFAKRSTSVEGSDETKAAAFLHSVLKEFACNSGDTAQPQTRYGSISSQSIQPVPMDFDARYSALWKRYVYYVCAGEGCDQLPFVWTRYAWQIKQSLDFAAMVNAAELLSGEHNFEWMCVMQQGEMRDPRRTVQLTVETIPIINENAVNIPYFLQQSQGTTIYKITGTCDFFLYKMMRRIVGILVAVGTNDSDLNTLRSCINAYDNHNATNQDDRARMQIPNKLLQTAPAKGLCLEYIEYPL